MNAKDLFLAAVEKAPAARAAYLDDACGGDAELRHRVEALLAAHEASGSLLDKPAPSPTGDYVPRDAEPGVVIAGRYTLVERIGEGGMGEVWVAKQSEPVKRRVALKLIKAGMDSRSVLQRFEQERQALALMDHPNIAKVLDGGLAPPTNVGGSLRPYFVMELVNGLPLTRFCDEAKLGIRERLELFVPICQAVQHAHQKGIVHRDLKPSNILVTLYDGKPVPKVIDFGVAKATGGRLTDDSMSTQFGAVVGTFEYMSPEQAGFSALDVDTRADIYSLGVILYELLTGLKPFDSQRLKKAALDEVIRIIREEEPPRPSTRLSSDASAPSLAAVRQTEPKRLATLMRGELDWVVMKCLEKQRDRRYETANGLARDVQRYLADEPVEARPPSTGYRLRKFVRRNRGAVSAVSAVFLALVGGLVMLYGGVTAARYGLQRARVAERAALAEATAKEQARADEAAQRAIADAEKRKAQEAEAKTLASYRASTDDAIEQLIGSKPEVGSKERAYLEKTLERWREFAKREGDDERSRAIRAEGHFRVALLWQKLDQRDAARTEYETARDIRKKLAAAYPAVPEYQQGLASTHNNLGILLRDLGQRDAARTEFETARDLLKRLAAAFPAVPQYQEELAGTHNNLGILLVGLGQRDAARTEYKTARDLLKKLAAAFPAVPEYQQELARIHNNLGFLLLGLGQRDAARTECETARDLYKKLAAAFPAVPQYQQELSRTHSNLGNLLADLGQRDAARMEYETARDLQKKLAAAFPAVPQYQISLGGSYCNFGALVGSEGKPADSLHWFDLAIRTLTPVHEKEPRDVTAKQFLRNSHWERAIAHDQLKQHAEALKDWDRAIELSPPADQPELRASRANSRLQAGQVAEAVAEVAALTAPGANATRLAKWNAGQWYDFACVYAVASGTGGLNPPARQEYADRAMELLQKAVKAGFKDAAHMAKDKDLDALRDREDFKKLLAELAAPKKP